MPGLLASLGARLPVVVAPMAGGPSRPELVVAAAEAGSFGLLAGGYLTVEALADQLRATRGAADRFGVNLFVPNPVPVRAEDFAAYAAALADLGARYGYDPRAQAPREDDDAFGGKVELLVREPVPVVSFTFGLPPEPAVEALKGVGTVLVQTVTDVDEARGAAAAGMDALVVQGCWAGGHSGIWDPTRLPADVPLERLVADVRAAVDLPVWAAGGIATPAQVTAVLEAGAEAAVVGTVVLRTPESGASPTYQRALADPRRTETVLTRAFSGRPGRALRNGFVDEFHDQAPSGYPAVHHLTSPIRRAATAAGDAEHITIWAGSGFRQASEEPLATVLRRLAGVG